MSTYSSFLASYPILSLLSKTFEITILPSPPAFSTIVLMGASIAFSTIWIPVFSSAFSDLSFANLSFVLTRATPPPTTIPSSTAARVAWSASSTLSFFSFISTSLAAPTYKTATPPANLASLSCSFSLS